ncbi:MAG TPA: flagellar hook-basal body complex protein FliE [Alphaproteobacteria bacterium]|nr:flagellar hook-basal body complex protein FliE [Alphaproteobacteria bacterium]HNS45189.1 flagellar hook-basal body complex protein FliE [Alphaproteobacteria bacterium]
MVDMIANPAAAASAYANMAKTAVASDGMSSESAAVPKASFGNMLEDVARSSIQTMKTGEKASAAGIAGTMDPLAITQAVTAAKLTLDTVVAVRDAAVEAYNKIQGMPI